MGKAKRKARPSMPHWFWLDADGCWFCRVKNNCNSCKAARLAGKSDPELRRRRDLRNDASAAWQTDAL